MNKNIERIVVQFYLPHPKLRNLMSKLRDLFYPIKPAFSGWGMKVNPPPPWIDELDSVFNKTSNNIKNNFQFSALHSTGIDVHNVDTLLWRHWIVSYAIRHVMTFSKTDEFNFVECGVADGLSSYYALQEINKNIDIKNKAKLHLYDFWGPMKKYISNESFRSYIENHIGEYDGKSADRAANEIKKLLQNIHI